MQRRHRLSALMASIAVVAVGMTPNAASATNPTTERAYAPFDRGTYVRSVYENGDVTYFHEPDSTYFTTGREDFHGFTNPIAWDLHSFFAFDVEATDLSVSKAVLQINVPTRSYVSDDPSETFAVVDVTSNIDTLLAGGAEGTPGLDAIWDDLGNGHEYGSRTFTSSDDGTTVQIPLDGTAKEMLKSGGRFVFGGHLTTGSSALDKIEQIFQVSGTSSVHLVLTLVDPVRPPAVSKFDAWIRNGSQAVAGYGVVNSTGKGQKLTRSVKKGNSTTFKVTITNSGSKADKYKVRAAAGSTAYTIKYKKGSQDITRAVTSGTYTTSRLSPGASLDLTLTVNVTSSAAKGSKITRPITVSLSKDSTRKDVVQAIVKRQ